MILEVMGRDAGHIALNSGIAGGADVILIPEIPYSIKGIANHIDNIRSNTKHELWVPIIFNKSTIEISSFFMINASSFSV